MPESVDEAILEAIDKTFSEVTSLYVLTCRTCGKESWESHRKGEQQHLNRCRNWLDGFDCMHHEDPFDWCKCEECD